MGILVTKDDAAALPPEPPHETIELKRPGDDTVKIDKRLAETISLLWGLGVDTIGCCEGSATRGERGHVAFASFEDALLLDRVLQSFAGLCHRVGLWLTGPRGTANGRGSYLIPFDGSFRLEPKGFEKDATLSVFLTFPTEEIPTLAAMLRCARVGSIEGFERVVGVEINPRPMAP